MFTIPKISIGKANHRNKFELDTMCHTTSEVGYIQPTFSKILAPETTIKVATNSVVRVSPLFVPTMGKIDLRQYHCFVPLNVLWTPFDAFITGTDYTLADGTQYRPSKVPHINLYNTLTALSKRNLLGKNLHFLYKYDLISGLHVATWNEVSVQWDGQGGDTSMFFTPKVYSELQLFYTDLYNGIIIDNHTSGHHPQYNSEYFLATYDPNTHNITYTPYEIGGTNILPVYYEADFVNKYNDDFYIATVLGSQMKRLRKVYLGLGYSFNPYDKEEQNIFKLMAYYKAWYMIFYPQRETNFYATNCYKLTKYLSGKGVVDIVNDPSALRIFVDMMVDIRDMRYILPMDYFSLADPQAETRGASTGVGSADGTKLLSLYEENGAHSPNRVTIAEGATSSELGYLQIGESYNAGLNIRSVLKLMRFVNRNTVVGKKVTDLLRMRFGIADCHEEDHEKVYKIGDTSTDVKIFDVMCQSPTENMELGELGGQALGRDTEGKTFTFDTHKEHGVFLSFCTIVPKTGYYQGMVKENSIGINDRFDFYSPEWDALGYDNVAYNELVADRMHPNPLLGSAVPTGTNLGVIGYVPRYTHFKVAKNICNGDISRPMYRDSMLAYTLDRHFDEGTNANNGNFGSGFLPDMTPENFRSIVVNDFNRIFADKSPNEDHFIIHIGFKLDMWANMRSLATSFDTYDDDGDTTSIDMNHE